MDRQAWVPAAAGGLRPASPATQALGRGGATVDGMRRIPAPLIIIMPEPRPGSWSWPSALIAGPGPGVGWGTGDGMRVIRPPSRVSYARGLGENLTKRRSSFRDNFLSAYSFFPPAFQTIQPGVRKISVSVNEAKKVRFSSFYFSLNNRIVLTIRALKSR